VVGPGRAVGGDAFQDDVGVAAGHHALDQPITNVRPALLPADQRARAVVLTDDYSEASPLVLLGTGLPPVRSGHNAFWDWGPPPADRTVVVHVGDWRPADWSRSFVGCHVVATVHDRLGFPPERAGEGRVRLHGPARPVAGALAGPADRVLMTRRSSPAAPAARHCGARRRKGATSARTASVDPQSSSNIAISARCWRSCT